MIKIKSDHGNVDILSLKGSDKRIIADLGAVVHKVLLLIANQEKSADKVFAKYRALAKELIRYINMSIDRIDELKNKDRDVEDELN